MTASMMDAAAFPGQEEPVSKTEFSKAEERWGSWGFRAQTLSNALKVLECKIFQNLTPHMSGRALPTFRTTSVS